MWNISVHVSIVSLFLLTSAFSLTLATYLELGKHTEENKPENKNKTVLGVYLVCVLSEQAESNSLMMEATETNSL